MLGLALGDALGAPHEGGPLERLLWRFIGVTPSGLRRFTDDTQMSIDLALSLISKGAVDQDDLASRFARSYHWNRGYGPGAAKVLKRIRAGHGWQAATLSVYPAGSFGNGGAMRAPIIGLFFHARPQELVRAARLAAEVTHAHPLAIEGATLIAGATAAALDDSDGPYLLDRASRFATSMEFTSKLALAQAWIEAEQPVTSAEVRSRLGMGITATSSCITSLYLATRFLQHPFEVLIAFAAEAGGDVDTVCAMAGAIWGARNGEKQLPASLLARLEAAPVIADIAGQLYSKAYADCAHACIPCAPAPPEPGSP